MIRWGNPKYRNVLVDITIFIILTIVFAMIFSSIQKDANARANLTTPNPYPKPNDPIPTKTYIPINDQKPYPPPINPQVIEETPWVVTPTVLPLVTKDGWYIYSDPEVGYSFAYPKDAHIDFGKGRHHPYNGVTLAFSILKAQGYHGMRIDVQPNLKQLSTQEYILEYYRKINMESNSQEPIPDNFLAKSEMIKVGNIQALKTNIPPTLTDFMLFSPYKDKIFIIYPTDDPFNLDDTTDPEALDLFYKILGTFEFN